MMKKVEINEMELEKVAGALPIRNKRPGSNIFIDVNTDVDIEHKSYDTGAEVYTAKF